MPPNKRKKLREVLRVMKGEAIDFSAFDKSVSELRKQLEEKVAIPTLDRVNTEIEKFQQKIDFTPLLTALEKIKKNVNDEVTRLSTELSTRLQEQKEAETYALSQTEQNFNNNLSSEISSLRVKIASLDMVGKAELQEVVEEIQNLSQETEKAISEIKIPPDREKEIKALEELINKLRLDLLGRIANIGGGNMNRQVLVGGANFLSKYTDYNIKAGSNMTITYANDDTNKRVNLTFASSGGGSSVGGTVRQIQTISVSSTIGTLSGTDQVYLVNQGVQIVMPAALGDTNLYTIKNVSNSSILIVGTIDGDANGVIMPVKYTSVDLISNDTDWNIT